MAELLDIYDENLAWLGVKERAAVHRDGDWHRVFQCWVISRDSGGRDIVVLQRRGPDKDFFPNRLDVSAAGHYAAGETVRDGVRELREELGVDVAYDDLIPLGMRVAVARSGGLVDHEFADVFFLVDGRPLDAYAYQRDELAGLVALEVEAGLALLEGGGAVTAAAVGQGAPEVTLTTGDFIPTRDDYVYKILLLARRCLNGETRLRV